MDIIIQLIQDNPWFGVATAATPTPKKGSFWAKVYGLVDWAALNVGKAKDKGED